MSQHQSMEEVLNEDPSSSCLWVVTRAYTNEKDEAIAGVWSDTPDTANARALRLWYEYNPDWMDCQDNVDGSRTEKGECYQGFSCVDVGSASVMIYVSKYEGYMGFGIQALKRILKSRNISIDHKGLKGKAAKDLLRKRLDTHIKDLETPNAVEEEQEEGGEGEEKVVDPVVTNERTINDAPSSKRAKVVCVNEAQIID